MYLKVLRTTWLATQLDYTLLFSLFRFFPWIIFVYIFFGGNLCECCLFVIVIVIILALFDEGKTQTYSISVVYMSLYLFAYVFLYSLNWPLWWMAGHIFTIDLYVSHSKDQICFTFRVTLFHLPLPHLRHQHISATHNSRTENSNVELKYQCS